MIQLSTTAALIRAVEITTAGSSASVRKATFIPDSTALTLMSVPRRLMLYVTRTHTATTAKAASTASVRPDTRATA